MIGPDPATWYCMSSAAPVDPLDAIEEKWDTSTADRYEWERRARRALGLARRWRSVAQEWEQSARKEAAKNGH